MEFLPHSYFTFDLFSLVGIVLLACLISGELVVKTKFLPRISGYIVLGILLGPSVFNIINYEMLNQMFILVNISLGLIFFITGRHLDFTWLKADKGLFFTCLMEFSVTFLTCFLLMLFFKITVSTALFLALLAASTSPAVSLLIIQDLKCEGPISRRVLAITSVNNFLVISAFCLLFPFITSTELSTVYLISHALYRFFGSLLLALCLFKIFQWISAYILEKNKQLQFILLIAFLIISISLSEYLNLSIFLVLLTLGIATRNFDVKHSFLDVNLGFMGHIFFIPLFFIIGCYLNLNSFFSAPFIVMSYVVIRIFSKLLSVFVFKNHSMLTNKQALCIGGALLPMSSTAIGITLEINNFNSLLSNEMLAIVATSLAFFGIFGPIIVQNICLRSGEAAD